MKEDRCSKPIMVAAIAVEYGSASRSDLGTIGECNCSICTKKGILHLPVPLDRFELLCGEGELTTYRFNTETAQHTFCRQCGIHAFLRAALRPRSGQRQRALSRRHRRLRAEAEPLFLTGAIGRRRSQRGRPPGHDSLPVTGGLCGRLATTIRGAIAPFIARGNAG